MLKKIQFVQAYGHSLWTLPFKNGIFKFIFKLTLMQIYPKRNRVTKKTQPTKTKFVLLTFRLFSLYEAKQHVAGQHFNSRVVFAFGSKKI